jgi:hypothetical protein
MALNPPQAVTDWVADSEASNHTTPDTGNKSFFRPSNSVCPLSILVGNRSILPVALVGDLVLLGPFYLNNILHTPHIIDSLLYVCCFTTDNLCSMEFELFHIFVKDLYSRNMIAKCNSP